MRGTKAITIENLYVTIEDMSATLAVSHKQNDDQRKTIRSLTEDILVLTAGLTTRYEVTTITHTGTRDIRSFSEKIDALHWATDQRISAKFQRVTISGLESRREALYPDGRSINGFGY